jgi:hypothetical protein
MFRKSGISVLIACSCEVITSLRMRFMILDGARRRELESHSDGAGVVRDHASSSNLT